MDLGARQIGWGQGFAPSGPGAPARRLDDQVVWRSAVLDLRERHLDSGKKQFELSNNGAISELKVSHAREVPADELLGWMEAIGRMNGLRHLEIDVSGLGITQYDTIAACLGPFSPVEVLSLPGSGAMLPWSVVQAMQTCQPPPRLIGGNANPAGGLSVPGVFQYHGEAQGWIQNTRTTPGASSAGDKSRTLTLCIDGHPQAVSISGLSDEAHRTQFRIASLFACKPDGICSLEELMVVTSGMKGRDPSQAFQRMQTELDKVEAALSGVRVCEMNGSGYYQLVGGADRAFQDTGRRRQIGSKRTRSTELNETDQKLIEIFTHSTLEFEHGETLQVRNGELTGGVETNARHLRGQGVLLLLVCASLPDEPISIAAMDNILSGKGGPLQNQRYRVNSAVSIVRNKTRRDLIECSDEWLRLRAGMLKPSSRRPPECIDPLGGDQSFPLLNPVEPSLRERLASARHEAGRETLLPQIDSVTLRVGGHEMSLPADRGYSSTQDPGHAMLHFFECKDDGVCSIVELMVLARSGSKVRVALSELRDLAKKIDLFNCRLTGGVVCAIEGRPGYCQLVPAHTLEMKAQLMQCRGLDIAQNPALAKLVDCTTLSFEGGCELNARSGTCTLDRQDKGQIRRQGLLILLILASQPGKKFAYANLARAIARKKTVNALPLIQKALESVSKSVGDVVRIDGKRIWLPKNCLISRALETGDPT